MQNLGALLPLILIVVVFYFFLLRPARNQQQRTKAVQQAIVPGARVITTAGMHATVLSVDTRQVVLEPAPGLALTFERAAVVRLAEPVAPAPDQLDEVETASPYPDASYPDAPHPDEGAPGTTR